MEKNQLEDARKAIANFDISSLEIGKLYRYLSSRLEAEGLSSRLANDLSPEEIACIDALMNHACNVPAFYKEHIEHKEQRIKVEKILLEKGTTLARLKRALLVFGISIRHAKELRKQNVVRMFELIEKLKPSHVREDGTNISFLSINTKEYTLK